MSITINGVDVAKVYCDGADVTSVYLDGTLVYSEAPPAQGPYLSFIERNHAPFTLKNDGQSKTWDGALYYSTDAVSWTEWDGTEVSSSNDGRYRYQLQ